MPDDELDAAVEQVVSVLKRSSPATSKRIRNVIDEAIHQNFSDQLDEEMRHQAVLIPRHMEEGARAFLDKREAEFPDNRD